MSEESLANLFPDHAASLSLRHNEHRDYYQSLPEWLTASGQFIEADTWVSEEQRLKALATDSCWVLQWYPDTPIGSYTVAAADLGELLQAAVQIQSEN